MTEGRENCRTWTVTMSIQSMKNERFSSVNEAQWKQGAEKTLKGKSIDTLEYNTYEQIRLKPLYLKKDVETEFETYPSFQDYRRGIDLVGYKTNPWKVAQQITANNVNELKQKLSVALKNGQTAISFQITDELLDLKNLSDVLGDAYTNYPFSIQIKEQKHLLLLTKLSELAKKSPINQQQITGFIAYDPLAELVEQGGLINSIQTTYDQWAISIEKVDTEFPQLKTIGVDTTIYHNSGANAVQELAIALAVGVNHIEQLTKRGLSLEMILSQMIFRFSIGANFFMEIAKLRAARLLWGKIVEAYKVATEYEKMVISAETATITKTIYDPYVNILRAGNEAFAAVLGGIQFLHVGCFDETYRGATEFSERVARNTQLIFKEEAHLKHVIDPAGGSWYIESLTNELAEKAWQLFLQIDEQGGIISALKSGDIQAQISKIKQIRENDVLTRQQSVIGTNKYANVAERIAVQKTVQKHMNNNILQDKIVPLRSVRLAEPFEKLRQIAERIDATVGVICIGELKAYKARADFLTSFFAAGGIKAEMYESNGTLDELQMIVQESNTNHFVICGSDETYEQFTKDLVKRLLENRHQLTFFVAGQPTHDEKEQWEQAGVQQFIHLKSNCYELLAQLINEMEGK